jgi:hypothetical protein
MRYGRTYATILISIAIVVFFILIALLFPLPARPSEPQGPQIVLEFNQSSPDGKIRFFTVKSPVGLGLTPLNNAAPLSPGTLSICRMETAQVALRTLDGKDVGPLNDIVFRCGQDRYIFTTLAVQ